MPGTFHGFDLLVPDAAASKQFSASWKTALRKAFATAKAAQQRSRVPDIRPVLADARNARSASALIQTSNQRTLYSFRKIYGLYEGTT